MCNYVENIFVSCSDIPTFIYRYMMFYRAPRRTKENLKQMVSGNFAEVSRGAVFAGQNSASNLRNRADFRIWYIFGNEFGFTRERRGNTSRSTRENLLRLSQRMKSPPMSNTPAHTFSLEHMEPMQQQPVDNLQVRLIHYALNIAK